MSDHPELGVCGVCGAGMLPPLVECPRCQSPHHQDCWEYNQGCSVYGCVAGVARAAPVAAEGWDQGPVAEAGEPAAEPAAEGGLVGFLADVVGRLLGGAPASAPVVDPDAESLARETKAVLARIGGDPTELAHAYGLFEQRHPRARLPAEAQLALALTLAQEGYRALAAEALEKCLGGPQAAKARAAYAQLLGDHPAYWEDLRMADERLPAVPKRDPAALRTGRRQYLVAHDVAGLPLELRAGARLPGDPVDKEPSPRARFLGPLSPAHLDLRLGELAPALGIPVGPEDLTLPPEVHPVQGMVLNVKGLQLATAGGHAAFGWDEVAAVFYESVESQESRTEVHYEPPKRKGQVVGTRHETQRLVTEYLTVLEVHAGPPEALRRFRVGEPHAALFEYLGRRRQLTYEANLRLVAKDLARFAPAALPSRGLLTMLSERRMRTRRARLESMAEFEEYVLWMHALGTPAVRAWWQG